MYNVPYRPDLASGIELIWRRSKWLYKNRVDWLKAQNMAWDQRTIVQEVHYQIDNEFAARQALKARQAIATAIPIYPLPHEVVRDAQEPFQSPYHGDDPDSLSLEAQGDSEHGAVEDWME